MPGFKQVFVQGLTEVVSKVTTVVGDGAKDRLGDIRIEGNKTYKYVQLLNATATVAVAVGDFLNYRAIGANGYRDGLVCSDATDADTVPVMAGVAGVAAAGVAGTSYFLWVQIAGHATVRAVLGTPAVGNPITSSTTDLSATRANSAGAAAADPVHYGVSLSTTTQVALSCPW